MSSAMNAYADMANDQRRAAGQRAANQVLRSAERAHGRNLALLVAALQELKRLDPDHCIHMPVVQAHIRDIGGRTIDRSSSFQPVWDLEFDLPAILAVKQSEHDAQKALVLMLLNQSTIEEKRRIFFFWKRYYRLQGQCQTDRGRSVSFAMVFSKHELAHTARQMAIDRAHTLQLGDVVNVQALLQSARETLTSLGGH